MEEKHDVTAFTGQGLLKRLLNLVENEWSSSTEHQFLINGTICFTITVTPTISQPGCGIIKFPNTTLDCPSWEELTPVVSSISFPANRRRFMNETLETLPIDESFVANVLLSFEIARREEAVSTNTKYPYPLLRKQTEQAIEKVMNSSAEKYPLQVNYYLEKSLFLVKQGIWHY